MPCCSSSGPKKGDVYICEECGLEVIINKDCECECCDLLCCGKPLTQKK